MFEKGNIMNKQIEIELLQKIQQDDKQSYKKFVELYLDKIWRLAYRVLRNEAEAEDATQEVFLLIWNKRHDIPNDCALSAWVYRVAYNKIIDIKRRTKYYSEIEIENIVANDDNDQENEIMQKQDQQNILQLINQLPENQMLAILWFYFEELKVDEISKRLSITEVAVRSLIKRGKSTLRDKVSEIF